MDIEKRLEAIHSAGYWRVNIRPTQFNPERIPSLTKCREIVESSIVRLRGWDYPHLDHQETSNGETWIESGSDTRPGFPHVEYWRFYQSGQFIHHLAFREDHTDGVESGRYLSILSTLYTVTEIFEFAARLAAKDALSPKAELSIKLVGTEGRQLTFWEGRRFLRKNYVAKIPEMTFSNTYSEVDLLGKSDKLALDATEWIFERFNWSSVPIEVLAEDQKKFLERRL